MMTCTFCVKSPHKINRRAKRLTNPGTSNIVKVYDGSIYALDIYLH